MTSFEQNCFSEQYWRSSDPPTRLRISIELATLSIAGVTFLLSLSESIRHCRKKKSPPLLLSLLHQPRKRWYSLSMIALLAFCWLMSFVCMWIHLVDFAMLRLDVAKRAGPSLEEGQFSFGQILALATWAPTILDFIVVWRGKCSSFVCQSPHPVSRFPN